MSEASKLALDHIIILLPAKAVDNLPKALTDAFTITPGGTHADGKTYNQLVVLSSGVYLEFIAFVDDDPQRKQGHWWGQKSAGTIIDWALTSSDVKDVEKLAEKGLYDEPRKGGRKRGDGKQVEWVVTFPKAGTERGSVPFFCHDVTPRELRVPSENTQHPSGAVGVKSVVVVAAADRIDDLEKTYNTVIGEQIEGSMRSWALKEPASQSSDLQSYPVVTLVEAKSDEDLRLVKENGGVVGVREISLFYHATKPAQDDIELTSGDNTVKIRLEPK